MNFSDKKVDLNVELYFWNHIGTFFFYQDETFVRLLIGPYSADREKRTANYWFRKYGNSSDNFEDHQHLYTKICSFTYSLDNIYLVSDRLATVEHLYKNGSDVVPQMAEKQLSQYVQEKKLVWPHVRLSYGDIVKINEDYLLIIKQVGEADGSNTFGVISLRGQKKSNVSINQ